MKTTIFACILSLMIVENGYCQGADYLWPMGSGSVQWRLSGLFMEFRNTGSFDHFHDGIDITDVPAPTGELVFPVDNGTVETIYYGGDNSYVSITHSQGTGRTVYLHIDPNDNLTSGQPVSVGTLLGSVRDIAGPGDHLHFNEGFNYAEVNPLQSGHIAPFDDERDPEIMNSNLSGFIDGISIIENISSSNGVNIQTMPINAQNQFVIPKNQDVDFVVRARDQVWVNGIQQSSNNLAIYDIDITVYDNFYIPLWEEYYILDFNNWINNQYVHHVYIDSWSDLSTFYYNCTNPINASYNGAFPTDILTPGNYRLSITVWDIKDNWEEHEVSFVVTPPNALAEVTTMPSVIKLSDNYPNPFNPETTIEFQLPKSQEVNLTIFNTLGQKIRVLFSGYKEAGSYRYQWNGIDDNGSPVSSGIYFYQLKTNNFIDTRKMLLIE